jgi:primosomal protein N' (replication factor Y)
LPVARVAVDVSLAHLDRPFDYSVPDRMREAAAPGARVRVRFAGQLVDGFVLDRVATSDHAGRLTALSRVVSAEPVLTPEITVLARAVADRYVGTLADVLRLAVPARHAAAEREPVEAAVVAERARPLGPPGPWDEYRAGPAFVRGLASGRTVRAVWSALPGPDAWDAIAVASGTVASSGRGVLVVVPDAAEVARASAAMAERLGAGSFTVLTADLGPKERYRRWLAVRRGTSSVVVGTRAAMFAPVRKLGLAVVWDDGDDLHAEPRAPYPHVREVLAIRSHQTGCSLLAAGRAVTAETAGWLQRGFAQPVTAARATVRSRAPRVLAIDEGVAGDADPLARTARLPTVAWRAARDGLASGPVLVQVPRRGYVPGLACGQCRARAQCAHCGGPLGLAGPAEQPHCQWCGRPATAWQCPQCGGRRVRAAAVGSRRTAEELGRAFPGVPVVTSGAGASRSAVAGQPALVVATPGAEPVADGGYAAALLLDAAAMLGRADLRVAEESLRRWLNAASLVRPSGAGGRVVVVGPSDLSVVQALIRWDPGGFATHELAARDAAGLPPAVKVAVLQGSAAAVDDVLERAQLNDPSQVLGPVPRPEGKVRMVVRAPLSAATDLASALRTAQAERSARKDPEHVRIQVDPVSLD